MRVTSPVPLDECRRRAMAGLDRETHRPASMIAEGIWPGTRWKAAQGAGAAASRILKHLQRDGLAAWRVRHRHGKPWRWGWVRTGP